MSKQKEHYKTNYHPQYNLSRANVRLYNEILNLNPEDVFEFGCNVGRHLVRLRAMGFEVDGMEINKDFVKACVKQDIPVWLGDETDLIGLEGNMHDLCFTNSVLCHMNNKEATQAIKELKRIASKYVLICECVSKADNFWWIHDYESAGFKTILEILSHSVKGANYRIMLWEK